MAEDDTFDIDIYGEEDAEREQKNAGQGGIDNLYDDELDFDYNVAGDGTEMTQQSSVTVTPQPKSQNEVDPNSTKTSVSQTQGTKRKAPPDEEGEPTHKREATLSTLQPDSRQLDPGATKSLRLAELQWWTTEEHLRGYCARAHTESELRDLSFGEHKINGKSRGEAYLEFATPQAATATKHEIEKEGHGSATTGGARKTPITVFYAPPFDPFRNASGAAVGAKKDGVGAGGPTGGQTGGRGGAYNNPNGRGNFGGGRGGFRGGGGGFNNSMNNNPMRGQNQPNAAGGWGAGGMGGMGMGGMGGFNAGANPMMPAFGAMGMGGFNMARGGAGGMMNMMGAGGRGGGFGMGGMNMMSGMGGRGGGMMRNGGGGWNGGWNGGGGGGGMQQQNFGGGGGGGGGGGFQQQQQGNKRAKME